MGLIRALFVVGLVLIPVGVALVYPPAGVIAAGLEAIMAGYCLAYVKVRHNETSRRPPAS
jgi:hypothetical protein